MEYTLYTAPVAAVKYLGSDALNAAGNGSVHYPAALTVGDVVGVDIIDLTKPPYELNRVKRYSYVVNSGHIMTGDDDAGNVLYELLLLVNADANRIVNAVLCENGSNLADGIQFTSRVAGSDFGIGIVPGVLGSADVVERLKINGEYSAASTTAVANNVGSGTSAQVLELEKYCLSWKGNGNYPKDNDLLWTRSLKVVNGETYHIAVIRFNQAHDGGLIVEGNPEVVIYITIPLGEEYYEDTWEDLLYVIGWFLGDWDNIDAFLDGYQGGE